MYGSMCAIRVSILVELQLGKKWEASIRVHMYHLLKNGQEARHIFSALQGHSLHHDDHMRKILTCATALRPYQLQGRGPC